MYMLMLTDICLYARRTRIIIIVNHKNQAYTSTRKRAIALSFPKIKPPNAALRRNCIPMLTRTIRPRPSINKHPRQQAIDINRIRSPSPIIASRIAVPHLANELPVIIDDAHSTDDPRLESDNQ
jgi:hypothetical protein